ncbi:CC/Se motif family (seleno)protein [Peribacillus sp. SCS-155]|uniref:CC/Se motif family (seleno)protein n=1 Tax=Peribacillus sedimenti TaxID=3115297 RepID=UPI003906BA4A
MDETVKNWVDSRGKCVTIETVEVQGCCVPGALQELLAFPKKPKNLQKFRQFQVDGVDIYVQRNVEVRESLLLKLTGFSIITSISAKAHVS